MTLTTVPFGKPLIVAVLWATAALSPIQAIAQTTETPVRVRYDFASVGLVPGQTIRVSVAFPPDPCRATSTGEFPPDPCRVRILLLDAAGERIADSGLFALPPGPTRTFDVERSGIDRRGEEGTGRVQVRVVVIVQLPDGYPPDPCWPPDPCRPGVEVLTTANGRTTFAVLPPGPVKF